jgi:hypothetical protein
VTIRVIRLYHARPIATDEVRTALLRALSGQSGSLSGLSAVSLFQGSEHHDHLALYTGWEDAAARAEGLDGALGVRLDPLMSRTLLFPPLDHTLKMIREYRRLPLDETVLGLSALQAKRGRAADLTAALSRVVEQGIGLFSPSYLLFAHSQEVPDFHVIVVGVREVEALEGYRRFQVRQWESLAALLEDTPAWFVAHPAWGLGARTMEPFAAGGSALSPT